MARITKVVLVLVLAFGISYCACAEMHEEAGAGGGHKIHQMKQKGSMPGMMGMSRSMVAAHDGGVFVLLGNKLQKYDKNLVLQKEVEIEMPKDMMQHMKKKCPMMDDESSVTQEHLADAKVESTGTVK